MNRSMIIVVYFVCFMFGKTVPMATIMRCNDTHFPTKFSRTLDFPALWLPTTAIWGKSKDRGTPRVANASWSLLTMGMRLSIPSFPDMVLAPCHHCLLVLLLAPLAPRSHGIALAGACSTAHASIPVSHTKYFLKDALIYSIFQFTYKLWK